MATQTSRPPPILLWFRRDLRLDDHPALRAAADEGARTGRPVIPVFIHDELVEGFGAAPRWRLGLALEHFARRLEGIGSRLILRRGQAAAQIARLVEETGASEVWFSRAYDPDAMARDREVEDLGARVGFETRSFAGFLLHEPDAIRTGAGDHYKVFTPYWKSLRALEVAQPLSGVRKLSVPDKWPASDRLDDWQMGRAMDRGARVVRPHVRVGEEEAAARLDRFVEHRVGEYAEARDFPAVPGTSNLSENLTWGEISPRQCWHASCGADPRGKGAETFRKELAWREFAYHLAFHTPRLLRDNWRPEWDGFAWSADRRSREFRAWSQGRTGIAFVDAAMREMYVTGRMHNRARMIAASYLVKHLLTDWRLGQEWFADCLVDWDPAANAMGWQWVAGSGPDAAPYFRVFNPETQQKRFDPDGAYVNRWLAEGRADPHPDALAYFDAIPRGWSMSPRDGYPAPVVDLSEGRDRALAAYADSRR
ncbi:deoxyribodipyrimidine photolyase [Brevirhabdus pacifica]|uniref:Deoxyribodipyrimidine photolyase n=1 Tax=Brevirhabdus pacifica TaxID=1267768 RepID=A0A1U7DFL2_9RHOB|nr:deoxyribodipyrimidine photo-lyase [Brevirhabdus pacifica]APX88762.1 deoxyribodipyrimidine photolyase [Brevirhabdus pacifica]OWU80016.1 deoxyribodipyrimidine photolyase [Loktanella sp. 22II-4b]PJJ86712.1 deoxyribodipyrimidine photo-lyase [Brevirhabdus pacifica]